MDEEMIVGGLVLLFNLIMLMELIGLYRLNEFYNLKKMVIVMILFNLVVGTLVYQGYLL